MEAAPEGGYDLAADHGPITPELVVGPNKVVPERVESLDRGLAAEAAVGSALIVEVEPGGQGALALG